MVRFFETYFKMLIGLAIALVVLFAVLHFAQRLPGVAGTTAQKISGAANGSLYQ